MSSAKMVAILPRPQDRFLDNIGLVSCEFPHILLPVHSARSLCITKLGIRIMQIEIYDIVVEKSMFFMEQLNSLRPSDAYMRQ